MYTTKQLLAVTFAAIAVVACATGPVYGPAEAPGDIGYSEQQIEGDRVVVRFNGGTREATAADFALLRAAEVTHQYGYDWFEVVRRDEMFDQTPDTGSGLSIGIGSSSGSRGSSVGVGVGMSFPIGAPPEPVASGALLEIIMRDGDAPDGSDAYDAADVIRSLGLLTG